MIDVAISLANFAAEYPIQTAIPLFAYCGSMYLISKEFSNQ